MSKRVITAFVVAAFAATVAPSSEAADKVAIGKASPSSSPMLPVDVGAKTGIYAKHGLDVEISSFGGGAKLHQAMAAGSIDIGVGAGPELALIAKGSPELAICNATAPLPFIGISVPQDSKVRSVDDLKGIKMGVSSVGSLTYWLARELGRTHGWGVDGVTTVAIGGEPAGIIAAFRTHAVDADIGSTSLIFAMEEQKEGRFLVSAASYVGNISSGTIFATRHLIDTNPDLIRRFLAGWFETVAFMRKNKEETVKIASEMTGFSHAVQSKEYDLTIGMYSEDGKFDAESLANLERSFEDLKLLDTKPDMAKLYTEAFLPKH